jgi:STE24 endopeptidase
MTRMRSILRRTAFMLALACASASINISAAHAQHPPAAAATASTTVAATANDSLIIPAGAQMRPGVRFDPVAATNAYLATVPVAARERSDAYFEGGYWLLLWGTLVTVLISILLLATGWSRAMRDRAARITHYRFLQTAIYWAQYIVLVTIISLPWDIYTGYFREHKYGLSTQNLGAWFGDAGKSLLLSIILGGIGVGLLYMVIRRFPRSWATWGTIVSIVFVAIAILVEPVFIVPIFNKVTLLKDQRVLTPVLRIAHANGLMTNDIYVVDESRESTRISANVSGMFGTERITMNDNLLNRASLPEIEAVMGHEIGHYVLNHLYKLLTFFIIVIAVGFMVLRHAFEWARLRWGEKWGVREISDPAGLPLVVLIITLFFFVITPVMNTEIRSTEQEADNFGLNAARQPDGFAAVALKLSDYRKLSPGPVEEFIFFNHPSGRTRIMTAMQWKAEEATP